MPNVNVSALSAELNQNVVQINEMLNLKMRTMEQMKRDFVTRGVNQKIRMFRKIVGNVSQPSFKDSTENFSSNLLEIKQREMEIVPAKIDLKFTEDELDDLSHGIFNELEPATPGDIHSLAGQEMILAEIFMKLEEEISAAAYKGVRGTVAALNGGLNLYDGLGVKFTEAIGNGEMSGSANSLYATTGAVAFTDVNILGELKKYRDKLLANAALTRSIRAEGYRIHINPNILVLAADAQDNALTNKDQVITKNAKGNWAFKSLPQAEFVESNWMDAVADNFFGTLPSNLYYGYGAGYEKARIKFQERGRDLVVLGDFKNAVDFADPRSIILYKGYGI